MAICRQMIGRGILAVAVAIAALPVSADESGPRAVTKKVPGAEASVKKSPSTRTVKKVPGATAAPKTGDAETTDTAAGDEAKTETAETSPHCENVQISIKNTSGQAIKLISVDYSTGARWTRGRILFRTIDDGATYDWSGSYRDMAGKQARFRVNTRYVVDLQTDTYSELNSDLLGTKACESEEKHELTIGKASG